MDDLAGPSPTLGFRHPEDEPSFEIVAESTPSYMATDSHVISSASVSFTTARLFGDPGYLEDPESSLFQQGRSATR
jgi:hypothetical protein